MYGFPHHFCCCRQTTMGALENAVPVVTLGSQTCQDVGGFWTGSAPSRWKRDLRGDLWRPLLYIPTVLLHNWRMKQWNSCSCYDMDCCAHILKSTYYKMWQIYGSKFVVRSKKQPYFYTPDLKEVPLSQVVAYWVGVACWRDRDVGSEHLNGFI